MKEIDESLRAYIDSLEWGSEEELTASEWKRVIEEERKDLIKQDESFIGLDDDEVDAIIEILTEEGYVKEEIDGDNMDEIIQNFVEIVLNNGNKHFNAAAYDGERFEKSHNVKVAFERNHRTLYNKVLKFCADNDLIVVSTHPATLEVTIRVEDK